MRVRLHDQEGVGCGELLLRFITALRDAGCQPRRVREGWMARCPAHEDRTPSLSIGESSNGNVLVTCFAGCSWGVVVRALGLGARDIMGRGPSRSGRVNREHQARNLALGGASPMPDTIRRTGVEFSSEDAQNTWRPALARTRDDSAVDVDRAAYEYLERRGLSDSWDARAYGILPLEAAALPAPIRWWPGRGYRIVVPLYDLKGQLQSIQARCIRDLVPKTLFPKGAKTSGLVFANEGGLRALSEGAGESTILVGEGLTDFLAASVVSMGPTLFVPGATSAVSCVGTWVKGRRVVLAFDADLAGEKASVAFATAAYSAGAKAVSRVRWSRECADLCESLAMFGPYRLGEVLEH